MRQFIVVGEDAPTTADFSLDALPEAGRMDLLARCVTASLLLSHGIREDTRTHLVLDDEFTVRFDGATVRGVHPDERSTAAVIRNALSQREEAIGHVPVEISPGISLTRMGLEATLSGLDEGVTICQLHETGESIDEAQLPANPAFILSNHTDLTAERAAVVEEYADRTLSLGPEAIHGDHAIAVAHNWLDRKRT